jgi:hypothetical protein
VTATRCKPIFFNGFNAALDLRWGPIVVSYSHGEGLECERPKWTRARAEGESAARLLECLPGPLRVRGLEPCRIVIVAAQN